MYLAVLASGLTALSLQSKQSNSDNSADTGRRGVCIMDSHPNEVAKGVVWFEQKDYFSSTQITCEFTCLTPGNKHGFHIH